MNNNQTESRKLTHSQIEARLREKVFRIYVHRTMVKHTVHGYVRATSLLITFILVVFALKAEPNASWLGRLADIGGAFQLIETVLAWLARLL